MSEWFLSDSDLEMGKYILQREWVHPLNETTIFDAALYSFLSQAQNFERHIAAWWSFKRRGLSSPHKILTNPKKVWTIIKKTRFPNQRYKRLLSFCLWWTISPLPSKLMEKPTNEINLRNEFAEKAYGIEPPDFKTISGLPKKEYLLYERIIQEEADDLGITPAHFQASLWSLHSNIRKTPLSPSQTILDSFTGGGLTD
ncbi:MAG: hypothetical protein AYK18_17230 [Theionarchaea archaeon DG-70]|nr:MAG: hypothetical protein AYK18_17230 [Theionarchaea archaeon DG-70]